MTLNYEKAGRPYADGPYADGIARVNRFVNFLKSEGELPEKFSRADGPKRPKSTGLLSEAAWKEELKDLDSNIASIWQAVSMKDENTLKGFNILMKDLAKEFVSGGNNEFWARILSNAQQFTEDVLQTFEQSVEAYKNSPKRPAVGPSGKVIVYNRPGKLTMREMRILIFGYGLLPSQAETSDEIIAKEGWGVKNIKEAKRHAGASLIHGIANKQVSN